MAPSRSRSDRSAKPRTSQKPKGSASKANHRKSTRLEARLTEAQKSLLQQAADLRGQTLTDFVVQAGEETATKVLERAGVVVLSAQDSTAFVDALLNPQVPGLRLTAAATRYLAILAP